jgi:hypothetical protein
VRNPLRASAVLAVVLGLAAAPTPRLESAQGSNEPLAASVSSAGKRGEAPAIRSGARPERRVAHALSVALPPVAGAMQTPPLAGAPRFAPRAARIARPSARSNGARAPPHTA